MPKKHKYIITGATGKIGTELIKVLNKDDYIVFTRSPNKLNKSIRKFVVDLSKDITIPKFKKYDTVIHLAAETHIDRCEIDREKKEFSLAWINNVLVTKHLTDYCLVNNKKLIMLSTECVFGGRKKSYSEKDKPSPINWYGVTKNESEKIILKNLKEFVVLRTVMAYGGVSKKIDLPKYIFSELTKNNVVHLSNNQKIAFTHTSDIVEAILLSSQKNINGIYHFCGPDVLSPYELGKIIAKIYKFKKNLLVSKTLKEIHGVKMAKLRLKYSVLTNKKFINTTGYNSFTDLINGLMFK